ncbi:MAG: HDOD domain-containing protein [Acidobacteria bacterium]|nr:HDOD domain-containing protein [Acidobacteriota bacterium]
MMITREQFTSRLKARSLPSLPLTVVALSEAVQDERCTVDRILGILSKDPSMSATLLRLANSALYSGEGSVMDLRTAVLRLGFSAVANLGTGAGVIRTLKGSAHLDVVKLWQHSVAVGLTAKGICALVKRCGARLPEPGPRRSRIPACSGMVLPSEHHRSDPRPPRPQAGRIPAEFDSPL